MGPSEEPAVPYVKLLLEGVEESSTSADVPVLCEDECEDYCHDSRTVIVRQRVDMWVLGLGDGSEETLLRNDTSVECPVL